MTKKSIFVSSVLCVALCVFAGCKSAENVDLSKAIDLEHHFIHPDYIDYVKSRTEYPYYKEGLGICYSGTSFIPIDIPQSFNQSDLAKGRKLVDIVTNLDDIRIAELDDAGVSTAVLSAGQGIEELPREEAVRLARATNDAVAAAIKRHPGRYQGSICLPTLYVEESVAELERAVKELGLKYWHTHSNYGGHYLFEEQFEPILAKCAELGVPFYLHPQYPSTPYLNSFGMNIGGAGLGFGVDVTRTATLLIMNGIFDKYPNLVMILGHMAEFFPYCLTRMDDRFGNAKETGMDPYDKSKQSFTYYFQHNIMMTTSGIFDPSVVMFAINKIGIDHIMLGTDFPYENFRDAVKFVKDLPISDEDKAKILYKNAETYILK